MVNQQALRQGTLRQVRGELNGARKAMDEAKLTTALTRLLHAVEMLVEALEEPPAAAPGDAITRAVRELIERELVFQRNNVISAEEVDRAL